MATGAIAVALALVVGSPVLDEPLRRCESARRANLDDALRWESRAEQQRIDLDACLARLSVRTATPTPAVVEFRAVEVGPSLGTLVLGGTAIGAVGVLVGLLIGLSANQ